jgi:hypothetical protein
LITSALCFTSGTSRIVTQWKRRLFEDELERPQRCQLSDWCYGGCFVFKFLFIAAAGSLQVQAIADVLAMLKSSSCTALDLDACEPLRCLYAPFDDLPSGAACGCTPTLCLRSFVAIPPQNEFRVFFVSAVPVAVSQRHVHQFYPHLHREIAEWRQRIHHFCSLLSSKLPLPTCVIDIAFTEQSPKV